MAAGGKDDPPGNDTGQLDALLAELPEPEAEPTSQRKPGKETGQLDALLAELPEPEPEPEPERKPPPPPRRKPGKETGQLDALLAELPGTEPKQEREPEPEPKPEAERRPPPPPRRKPGKETGQLDALLAELPGPDGGGRDQRRLDGAEQGAPERPEREPDEPEAAAGATGAPRGKRSRAGAYERLDGTDGDADDNEETYIPPPAVAESETDLDETAARVVRGHNLRLESAADSAGDDAADDGEADAIDPPARAAPPASAVEPATAAGSNEFAGLDPGAAPPVAAGGASRLWMAVAATSFVALAVVLYTQTDLFFPERRRAKREAARRAHDEKQREIDAARVRTGQISVDSTPGEAAVWMSLGRTPVETMPLPASVVHQIRVEHEGFTTRDVNVMEAAWSGTTDDQAALVTVELELAPRRRRRRPVPAAPPAPASARTGRTGRGAVRVESQPAGAQAYLLVGFTPDMTLRGVQAGLGYEFKVVKDGHSPGFVVVRPEDWAVEGAPTDLATSVSVTAELVPLEK